MHLIKIKNRCYSPTVNTVSTRYYVVNNSLTIMMSKQYIKRLTTKPNERAHNILKTKLDNNN